MDPSLVSHVHAVLRDFELINTFWRLYTNSTGRIFAIVNCSINVIIYWIFNAKFKDTLVSIFDPNAKKLKEDASKHWKDAKVKMKTVAILSKSTNSSSAVETSPSRVVSRS